MTEQQGGPLDAEAIEDAITLLRSGYVNETMPPEEPDETIGRLEAMLDCLAPSSDASGDVVAARPEIAAHPRGRRCRPPRSGATGMSAPTTEAGKALFEREVNGPASRKLGRSSRGWNRTILAIEREAAEQERARLRRAIEALPQPTLGLAGSVSRDAVLRLLEPGA